MTQVPYKMRKTAIGIGDWGVKKKPSHASRNLARVIVGPRGRRSIRRRIAAWELPPQCESLHIGSAIKISSEPPSAGGPLGGLAASQYEWQHPAIVLHTASRTRPLQIFDIAPRDSAGRS